MGRPPIGKRAMTAAQRQRRHRAQLQMRMPTEEEAEESWQNDLYDQACFLVLERMTEATRQRFLTAIEKKRESPREAAAEFASPAALIDPSISPVTKPARSGERDREIAALKTHMAELQSERDQYKQAADGMASIIWRDLIKQ
jgi:hypothetical protein